jgi:hypothetical protein
MADPSYINSQSVDWDQFYQGMYPTTPQPSYQAGMLGRGLPADNGLPRLPQSAAGQPAAAPAPPGGGVTSAQINALGGWVVDPKTGQLAYSQPSQNAAAAAAGQMAQGVAMPRPRPPWAPTTIDMAAISGAQQGANPGMGGAMIGNGVMSPAIPAQQPPPGGAPQTKWADDIFGMGGSGTAKNGTVARANGTNGYVYGQGADGQWNQQGYAPISVGRGTYTPTSGAAAYALANLAGQQKAQQTKAASTGAGTNGYDYYKGVRMQQNPAFAGLTPAQQYEVANGRLPTAPAQDLTSMASGEARPITPEQMVAMRQGNRQGVLDLKNGY